MSLRVNGTVVDIKVRTIGGVVQRGEPILSIVPEGDELIVEARLTPMDVKAVHSRPRGPPQSFGLVEPAGAEDSRHRPDGLS